MALNRNNKEIIMDDNKPIKNIIDSNINDIKYSDWLSQGKPQLDDWSRLVF